MLSHDDLIDGLRDGLDARSAEVDAPDDLAASVRRTARRRSVGRSAMVAAPVLLVAGGLVAVLATSGSTRPVPARDAAYVAEHVRARLAHAGPGSGVRLEIDTTDPGTSKTEVWTYVDPRTHVEHDAFRYTDPDGRTRDLAWTTVSRQGRRVRTQDLTVDPRDRTWSSFDQRYTVSGHGAASSYSGPAQIAHALKTGYFSLGGTTTLDGQRALKIRLPRYPRRDHAPSGVLYVNARTYEPLSADTSFRDGRYTYRSRLSWLPATRSTIARAVRRPPVPAGYRKVPYVPPGVTTESKRRQYLRDERQIERRRRAIERRRRTQQHH
jgi:hypothetical protein